MPESSSADGQFLSRRARREAERAAAAARAETTTSSDTAASDAVASDAAEPSSGGPHGAHTAPIPESTAPERRAADGQAPDSDEDLDEDDDRANELGPVAPRRPASNDPWKRPRRRRELRDGSADGDGAVEPASPESADAAATGDATSASDSAAPADASSTTNDDGNAPRPKSASELAEEPTFSSRAALKRYLREHGLDRPADGAPPEDSESPSDDAPPEDSSETLVANESAPDAVDADSAGTKASGLSEAEVDPPAAVKQDSGKPGGKKQGQPGKKAGQSGAGGKKQGGKKQGAKNRPGRAKGGQQKSGPAKAGQAKTGQGKAGPAGAGQAKGAQEKSGPQDPGPQKSEPQKPGRGRDSDNAAPATDTPEDQIASRGKGAFGEPTGATSEHEPTGDRQVPLPPGATRFPASAWATAKKTELRRGESHRHAAGSTDKHSAADASAQGKPRRRPVVKPPATAQVSVVTGAMPLSDAGTTGSLRPITAPVAKSGASGGTDFDDGSEVEDPPAPPLRASRAVNSDEPVLGRGGPSSTTLIVIGAAVVVAAALVVIGVLLVNG